MPDHADDTALELAHDAALKHLTAQDTSLSNARAWANNLLVSLALFAALSVIIGLIKTDPKEGTVYSPLLGMVLLIAVVSFGVSVLIVLWPTTDWVFAPSASVIMAKRREGLSPSVIRADVVEAMIDGTETNQPKLEARQTALRWVAGLLILNIALIVLTLVIHLEGGS